MALESTMKSTGVIREQPNSADPQEVAIRALISEEFSTDFSLAEIARMRQLQLDFLKTGITLILANSPLNKIREKYLALLIDLAKPIKIVSGEKFISELPGTGFIVTTNHLAMPKATRFSKDDLIRNIPPEGMNLEELPSEIEPFPIRLAAPAMAIGNSYQPYEIAIALSSPLDQLQAASEVIVLPSTIGGRFATMTEHVSKLFTNHPRSYVVTYPESGTTGKRGGGGLYGVSQEKFHTGFIRLAQNLEIFLSRKIPIVVVAQAFNPQTGFEVSISAPLYLPQNPDDNYIDNQTKEVQLQLHRSLEQITSGWK